LKRSLLIEHLNKRIVRKGYYYCVQDQVEFHAYLIYSISYSTQKLVTIKQKVKKKKKGI